MSGTGKTQLARTFALKEKLNYDFIWFFDYNNDSSQQYLNLAKEINKNIGTNNRCLITEDIEHIQKNVLDFLNNSNKRWLFVVDSIGIPNIEGVDRFIKLASAIILRMFDFIYFFDLHYPDFVCFFAAFFNYSVLHACLASSFSICLSIGLIIISE